MEVIDSTETGDPACMSPLISETSPFLRLPRELRDIIYKYALSSPYKFIPYIELVSTHPLSLEQRTNPPSLGLLSTNKQIRDESLPILFGCNTWSVPHRAINLESGYMQK